MTEIDTTKKVYLFTHGRMDLQEKSIGILESNGFSKENMCSSKDKRTLSWQNYHILLLILKGNYVQLKG